VWQERIIREGDLGPYLAPYGDRSLPSRMRALYDHQKQGWSEFRRGHDAVERAQARRVELGRSWVLCQHTPHRMTSVSAHVDPVSVLKRPCFLCPENLYPQEKGLEYTNGYLILCNVSPIFDFHLVITHRDHVPQRIQPYFDTVLRLTRDLSPLFALIYNGPRCGASAPDHLHFQAFPAENLPLESQIWGAPTARPAGFVIERERILITAPADFFRHFLIFQSDEPTILSSWFDQTLEVLSKIEGVTSEPMINLVMAYRDGQWEMTLFPRDKHRPRCYHGQGDSQLLISPGAIDMAGVFVIPRKKDYDRVDAATLGGIYQEVTLDKDRFSRLIEELIRRR
jgi:hypothetical protein